jgi:hypothetical protein
MQECREGRLTGVMALQDSGAKLRSTLMADQLETHIVTVSNQLR